MGMIKSFLFHHGEKVAFGLVAILCLWSIFGTLTRPGNILEGADGKQFEVDLEAIEKATSVLKGRLNSNERGDFTPPPVENVIAMIEENLGVADDERPRVDWSWLVYARPPAPRPWIYKDIVHVEVTKEKGPVQKWPPAEYRTAIGRPIDWTVRVGSAGILVTAKDSPATRWPKDGTVKVALFRKLLGEGREDADKALRSEFLDRRQGQAASAAAAATEEQGFFSDLGDWGMPGASTRREPTHVAETTQPGRFDWTLPAGVPASFDELVETLTQQEKDVARNVRMLCDPSTMVPTGWEVVTVDMPAYVLELGEEQIAKALTDGKLPAPEAVKPAASGTGGAPGSSTPTTPTTPKILGDGWGLPKQPEQSAAADQPEGEAAAPKLDYPTYEPHFYAFLDKAVDENMVYRYRLVAYVQANDLPKEIKSQPEHASYTPNVEMGDMGDRFFAYTTTDFRNFFDAEQEKRSVDAQGLQIPNPRRIEFVKDEETGQTTMLPLGLRDPETRERTPLAVAYLKDNAYSLFTYTDVVLTPLRRRISLSSAIGYTPAANRHPQVRLRVEAIRDAKTVSGGTGRPTSAPRTTPTTPTAPTGEEGGGGFGRTGAPGQTAAGDASAAELLTRDATYTMDVPEQVTGVTWNSFLVVGPDGKVKYGEDGLPVLKDPAEVYEPLVRGVELPEIGKDGERIANEIWDFRTGWSLVDARRCNVIVRRYRDPQRKEFRSMSTQERAYVVIRETNPAQGRPPRYKRIIQRIAGLNPEDNYTLEVQWEPTMIETATAAISKKGIFLSSEDVTDWRAFCQAMAATAGTTDMTAQRRIFGLLSQATQDLVTKGSAGELTAAEKASILADLNGRSVLDSGSLYPDPVTSALGQQMWPSETLPAEAVQLIRRHPRALSDLDLRRLNRLLLQVAFPKTLRPMQ